MKKQYITSGITQTQKIAQNLAKEISKKPRKKGLVVGLEGDLGGAKTTFVQGFAKGLGIKDKILSPTFIIYRKHGNLYHFDCYRIKGSKDLLTLVAAARDQP